MKNYGIPFGDDWIFWCSIVSRLSLRGSRATWAARERRLWTSSDRRQRRRQGREEVGQPLGFSNAQHGALVAARKSVFWAAHSCGYCLHGVRIATPPAGARNDIRSSLVIARRRSRRGNLLAPINGKFQPNGTSRRLPQPLRGARNDRACELFKAPGSGTPCPPAARRLHRWGDHSCP